MWNVTQDVNGTEFVQLTNVVSGCNCAQDFNVNLTLNARKDGATGMVTNSTVYRSVIATASFGELTIDFHMKEHDRWSESEYCVSDGVNVLGIKATQCTSAGEVLLSVFIPIICVVFIGGCLVFRYRKMWECYTDERGESAVRWRRYPPPMPPLPQETRIQHQDSVIPAAEIVRDISLINDTNVPIAKIAG